MNKNLFSRQIKSFPRKFISISLSLLLLFTVMSFSLVAQAAKPYRPILVAEKLDLSRSISAPFSISKEDDEVTDAATAKVVSDAEKGKALHISGRKNSGAGISVNLAQLAAKTGKLDFEYSAGKFVDGEFFALSFSIKAAPGKSFYIMPVLGGGGESAWNEDKTKKIKDSNGYLGGIEARWKVTDKWTTIGISPDGTLSFFAGDETYQVYKPDLNSWCVLYFATFSNEEKGIWDTPVNNDYFISEFNIWAPMSVEKTAAGFVEAANALPEPSSANIQMRKTIEVLDAIYDGLSSADKNSANVVKAKKRLEELRAAMKVVKSPFNPTYSYNDEKNLLAPYGDLESFDGSSLIWSENSGNPPRFTLIDDASAAKQGGKCLLISEREFRGDVSYDITPMLKKYGGGYYQFSAWFKSADKGVALEVLPLVLYAYSDGTVKEYEIGEGTADDNWTLVGVSGEDEGSFNSSKGGLPEVDNQVKYVALRFYVIDSNAESQQDMYADYYIDDLRFWKTTAPKEPSESSDQPKTDEPKTDEHKTEKKGLSTKAAIAIGVAVGLVLLAGGFCLFWFVIRKKLLPKGQDNDNSNTPSSDSP